MLWDTRQQSLDVITSQLNPTNDPAFRIVRDKLAVELLASRRTAQRQLFLAGRALEYEINQSLAAMGPAVLSASNEMRLSSLSSCLDLIHSNYLMAYGTPQEYSTTVSVRKMLGITGVRKDEVTDEELTEGAYLRETGDLPGTWDVAREIAANGHLVVPCDLRHILDRADHVHQAAVLN